MVSRAHSCDRERLELLLDDQLDEQERSAVEQHLDECPTCCHALETLAAGPDWWEQASSFLTAGDGREATAHESGAIVDTKQKLVLSSPLSSVTSFVGEMSLDFLEPSDSPAMLGTIGGYDVIGPIGCGGMGVVLKGYDQELNRFVAIKVLAPHYATSAAARKRFAREAQASAAVVHPHVVAIHAVDSSGRLPYLVMPYVQGESLQQRIDDNGPLELKETLRIAMQAARGLEAAHEQGLVHRDIKPGNILIEKSVDRILLTDFGLARAVDDASMTRSGVIAGTPQYMSPEQARGDAIDHRSDLFSLGSVIYTMCTGRPPFRSETTMGLLRRIADDPPRPIREVNADVPEWLAVLVERLHAKSPDDRLATARELADLLEKCLAHVQHPTVSALPETLSRPVRHKPSADRRWMIAGSMLVGVCLIGATWKLAGTFLGTTQSRSSGEQQADTSGSAGGNTKKSQTDSEPVPAWDDDLDGRIQSLQLELDQLQWQLESDTTTTDSAKADVSETE